MMKFHMHFQNSPSGELLSTLLAELAFKGAIRSCLNSSLIGENATATILDTNRSHTNGELVVMVPSTIQTKKPMKKIIQL